MGAIIGQVNSPHFYFHVMFQWAGFVVVWFEPRPSFLCLLLAAACFVLLTEVARRFYLVFLVQDVSKSPPLNHRVSKKKKR